MTKPTKIFLIGIVLAAFSFGGGKAYEFWLSKNLRDLEAECVREGKENPPDRFPGILVCDAESLSNLESGVGIQAGIVEAKQSLTAFTGLPLVIAFSIAILFALPFAWYFLLQRVRELKEAIVGK